DQTDYLGGVCAQSDCVIQTERRNVIVKVRSEATLNRQGVRLGTAEMYAALGPIPEVAETTVIGVKGPDGDYWMPLFVQLSDGAELTDELRDRINTEIRSKASARHVPDEIIAVEAIPVTHTGKRIEVPLKKLFSGQPADKAINRDAIANPDALAAFIALAEQRSATSSS